MTAEKFVMGLGETTDINHGVGAFSECEETDLNDDSDWRKRPSSWYAKVSTKFWEVSSSSFIKILGIYFATQLCVVKLYVSFTSLKVSIERDLLRLPPREMRKVD
jgi:hypothetical protein